MANINKSMDSVDQLAKNMGPRPLADVNQGMGGGLGSGPFCTKYISGGYNFSDAQLACLEANFQKKPNPTMVECIILAEKMSIPNSELVSDWFAKRREQAASEK